MYNMTMPINKRLYRGGILLLLLFSLTLIGVSSWPQRHEQAAFPMLISTFTENEMVAATPAMPSTEESLPRVFSADEPAVAAKENRTLILEWPESIRVGESDLILLALEVDEGSLDTPTSKIEGLGMSGKPVELPNLYETHQFVVEARLDMSGPDVTPQGTFSEALRSGQKVQFAWSISPTQPGVYRGMLWLYLNIRPIAGGEIVRRTLLARPVEIESGNVLGFSAQVVRWAGIASTLTSAILGAPLLQEVLLWLGKRLGKKKEDKKPHI